MTAVPSSDKKLIHVVAAALVNAQGAILLAKRHDDAHQGGLWEFPGGKLEDGEPLIDGLCRELHEELGIEISESRPLIKVVHHYADRSVLLDVFHVTAWTGEPHGREGQPLVWAQPHALADYPMPAADVPIVTALQLPSSYLITPPQLGDPKHFLEALARSLAFGSRLVQLRLFDIDRDQLLSVGRDACELCHRHGARVLLNGPAELAAAMGADGLHLNSRQLHQAMPRVRDRPWLTAASCHTPDDLAKASALGADFALLSPVLPTRSHPDAEPLGWFRFSAWVEAARIPVYALGGMRPDLLPAAWQHGAQGIAGIRGLWKDVAAG